MTLDVDMSTVVAVCAILTMLMNMVVFLYGRTDKSTAKLDKMAVDISEIRTDVAVLKAESRLQNHVQT